MPIVHVEMWKGRTVDQKEKMIQGITKVMCDSVGCSKEHVWVVITDVDKENWGIAGDQCSKTK